MTKLVVGRFDNIDAVKRVLEALPLEGFERREFGMFYTGPPGQHDILSTGGDAHSDEGAKDAGTGAVTGAALGGAAGLAVGAVAAVALPIVGVAAALVAAGIGAYVGSLHGAMSQTGPADESDATPAHPAEQPGGPRVAICVERPGTAERAITILERFGAEDIGQAEGVWHDRAWQDFDPRVPPEPVDDGDAVRTKAHAETP
jgi:hypothetical protein